MLTCFSAVHEEAGGASLVRVQTRMVNQNRGTRGDDLREVQSTNFSADKCFLNGQKLLVLKALNSSGDSGFQCCSWAKKPSRQGHQSTMAGVRWPHVSAHMSSPWTHGPCAGKQQSRSPRLRALSQP